MYKVNYPVITVRHKPRVGMINKLTLIKKKHCFKTKITGVITNYIVCRYICFVNKHATINAFRVFTKNTNKKNANSLIT